MPNHDVGTDGPARDYVLVTPADSNLAREARALWVTVTGDLVIRSGNGNDMTIPSCPVGPVPLGAAQVRAATTATVYALY
jgi:uncharacterized protein YgiB involved in biofilm formation